MTERRAAPTVGRDRELGLITRTLDRLQSGRSGVLALVGEPGIGKSQLLRDLIEDARGRGVLVLAGRAGGVARELPYGPIVDALDEHLQTLDRARLRALAPDVAAHLAAIFPALDDLAPPVPALAVERYQAHRAVVELLARLALTRPLVLALDDMHDADPASQELLGALLRRTPEGHALVALAMRGAQVPPRLAESVTAAQREGVLTRIELGPLDPGDAVVLLGEHVAPAHRGLLLRESGGNPFYLEQLARAGSAPPAPGGSLAPVDPVLNIPAAVAQAISGELAGLDGDARRLLEGAAVTGDPFDPALAAAAAELDDGAALAHLDVLLESGLVRTTAVPRQFRFRHPLVRRAVYEHAGGGWRLAAHGRVAALLERRGAGPALRANHIQYSAQPGEEEAIALLTAAGDAVGPQTPGTAAEWYGAALRLLPDGDADRRRALLKDLAGAESAAGRLEESRRVLLEALELTPDRASAEHIGLVAECAAAEHWLGRHEDARRRLLAALAEVEDGSSPAAATLLLELSFDALYGLDLGISADRATEALAVARGTDDRGLVASAAALLSLVCAAAGRREAAEDALDQATAAVSLLSDREQATRLDALWYLAWAETFLDRYDAALGHIRRGLELSRATGQNRLVVPLMLSQVFPLEMQGRVAEAREAGAAAVEAARLTGNTHHLFWSLWEYGLAVWYAGDLSGARAALEESRDLAGDAHRNILWEAEPGWALSSLLVEEGELHVSRALTLRWCGGPELPLVGPAERSIGWDILVDTSIGLEDLGAAEAYAQRIERHAPEVGRPLAAVLALRARAAVELATGDASVAAGTARDASARAEAAGIHLEAHRARVLLGRALAAAGDRAGAVRELLAAEQMLDEGGAHLLRDQARRELRRLGHRLDPVRRRPGGAAASTGDALATLSSREREVAALVAAGRTNRAIGEELFLSVKTVESHLRNVFDKLGVRSRAEVAAAVARAGGE
jgi:DNA-binding CsgD family transcriptional regulator